METTPKYVFWGFVVLVGAAVASIWLYSRNPRDPNATTTLSAKGSTFVYPLMIQWSNVYEKKEAGCKIDYAPVGSGDGIKKFLAGKVDFACTDGPLTNEETGKARAAGGEVLHIPLVLGAVVPVYNLPEASEPLRFSGSLLAEIYLGKVKKWNHPSLKALNPKVADQLPDKEILVVRRSDGSGTTYIWVDYLGKISKEWNEKVGVGTEVNWPVGAAEAGNENVAERVKKTPGSIGYVELTYAIRYDLAFGLVRNRAGAFVRAGVDSIKAAAANGLKEIPDDLRYSLTDAPGDGSYPICGTTWAIVREHPPADKGRLLRDFLYWATQEGQENASWLLYVPLPEALRERSRKQIARIREGT